MAKNKNKNGGTVVEVVNENRNNPIAIGVPVAPGHNQPEVVITPKRDWDGNWDFRVNTEKLKTAAGVESGISAVINATTGEVVGQYKGDKVIENKVLVEMVSTALKNAGVEHSFTGRVTNGGSRFYGVFQLDGREFLAPDGDKVRTQVLVRNSYDRSLLAEGELQVEKMVCLNQATAMKQVWGFRTRHVLNNKLTISAQELSDAIEHEKNSYLAMSKIPLTLQEGQNIAANIAKNSKIAISEKTVQRLQLNWLSPTDDEKAQGDTLFRFFNAGTRLLRNTAETKFELSKRLMSSFVGQIGLAMERPAALAQLKAAVCDVHAAGSMAFA